MPQRYPLALIILHWLLAVLIFGMLASGLLLGADILPKAVQYPLFQWHKAFGVAVLVLASVRIVVRLWAMLAKRLPALPTGLAAREALLAHLGHLGLYALMLAVPLAGWVMVSSSPYGLPTLLWGSVAWPHVPGLAGNGLINGLSREAHELLAYALLGLVVVHVAAVVKHRLKDGLNLLPRMGIGR